jgi:predicted 3-demethylubiquinone-9 3-methyltransferase (glyoxalase superfamily)
MTVISKTYFPGTIKFQQGMNIVPVNCQINFFIKNRVMAKMQKISTNLWFDREAEEAVNYYLSIFKNSGVRKTTYYSKAGYDIHKMPAGTVMTIEFELEGQVFVALNGGPVFKFNEAVSFIVNCDTQEEIDYYWDRLSQGGDKKAQQCGWLKDRYGLSWQIVPANMGEMFSGQDAEKSSALMNAILKMKKLDIKKLEEAYYGAAVPG